MLKEYAIIHDIFDESCYSVPGTCEVYLNSIKEALFNDGMVRNLYSGKWSEYPNDNKDRFNKRGQELLKKLIKQNRLAYFKAIGETIPSNDEEWITEALNTHQESTIYGIITNTKLSEKFNNPLISSIEKITKSSWWTNRSNSTRLGRQIVNYLKHLDLILRFSNSMMFIDPHIDPSKHKYKEFIEILRKCKRGDGVNPPIEIHRVCYEGSGPSTTFPSLKDWQQRFTNTWQSELKNISLNVEVFIWDDFHDRYLISNLIGISCPNGFDTTTDLNDITTWTKLGRADKDDVQREFDPASNKHQLKHRFRVLE